MFLWRTVLLYLRLVQIPFIINFLSFTLIAMQFAYTPKQDLKTSLHIPLLIRILYRCDNQLAYSDSSMITHPPFFG